MCSPKVAQLVNERVKREGLPNLSRRNFLRFGGVMAAGMGLATPVVARPQRYGYSGVIDLSHALSPTFPVFPAFKQATVETLVTVEDNGFYAQQWTFGEHTSTHMDFPGHFIADGKKVDEFNPANLVGPAVVLDISSRVSVDNPDTAVTVEDIEAWESANGEIPVGAFVFMYSGWEEKLKEEGAYTNQAENGSMHFPGFSKEAAEFLASNRTICGIGVDTLSLDIGASTTFDVHYTILGAGLLGIENVANLSQIMDQKSVSVVCGIPKYEKGSGGPARILALIEE